MGEALKPGPPSSVEVTFAAINPTTVLDKVIEISSLNAQVILASETAATANVQRSSNAAFRARDIRCIGAALFRNGFIRPRAALAYVGPPWALPLSRICQAEVL